MSSDWEAILRDVIKGEPCCDRPFVCNYSGFPDECNVVFVGQCPKHPLRNINWWDMWNWGSDLSTMTLCGLTNKAPQNRLALGSFILNCRRNWVVRVLRRMFAAVLITMMKTVFVTLRC